ncbi:spore-associated protein [Nocardiopsis changdeensis]|uniref:Spore-associated protein n=1 Tax=Nocardiopsis changdeensis TaxID=2831969 RepID=A0ABX8BLV2_9ACTN|nr:MULTISPECIES: spore-associated protein [Nocardiopsis]QUX23210.1 spore-associated protein [Nocardiopsis changdeensis]QYX39152.1 spore-associated protein [Nocardiopsis sp. MT53]
MRRRTRTRASWAGVLVAAVAAVLLSPTSAVQAADPVAICNSGSAEGALTYTQNAAGWPRSIPGGGGTMYLFYEGNLGQNCAVTVGSGAVDIGLRVSGGAGAQWSTGNGVTGPVYVRAKGVCVDVTGSSGGRSHTVWGTNCGS